MLSEDQTVSSSSALLYHLDSEATGAQRKRKMSKIVLVAAALVVVAVVGVVGQYGSFGKGEGETVGVSMKMQKQGSAVSAKTNDQGNSPNLPPCAVGKYRAAGGSECYDCPAGYMCQNDKKSRCPAGTYQDKPGKTKCKFPGCGRYVETAGSRTSYPCRPGFYQVSNKKPATQCLPAPAGSSVSKYSKKCKPTKCAPGLYQDCKGQSMCMEVPCGHKAPGIGNKKPTKCPAGTYQEKAGQETCKKADVGHYALAGACHQTECKPGRYQPKTGQASCKNAGCGYFVSGQKKPGQEPCPKGTFQPEKGARKCLSIPKGAVATKDRCYYKECKKGTYQKKRKDGSYYCEEARCGYFVESDGEHQERKCGTGQYQPKRGQDKCLDVPAGAKPTADRCGTKLCPKGTFKKQGGKAGGDSCDDCPEGKYTDAKGQSSCLPAPCGTYVAQKGQSSPTACEAGKYQTKLGQSSCVSASPGKYAPGGGCEELDCRPGTYTSASKQAMCKDADCGHFVAGKGSAVQEPCGSGEYQPLAGQSSCLVAPPGSFPGPNEKGEKNCGLKECQPGTYQDKAGATSCKDADCGHFVNQAGSAQQFPCPKGRYAKDTGSTQCVPANEGQFVEDGDRCRAQPCASGTYSDCKGQNECYPVPCGYEPKADKSGIEACKAGYYQDKAGQTGCKKARKGHFTDGAAYCFDEPCERGTFQAARGQKSCDLANCGEYVDTEGAKQASACPAGTYQPEKGSVGCLSSTMRLAPRERTCTVDKEATCVILKGKSVAAKSPKDKLVERTMQTSGACLSACKKEPRCKCFRFELSGYGYTGKCTLLSDCKVTYLPKKPVEAGECRASVVPKIGLA